MTTEGRHLLVEYTECNPRILNSKDQVAELMHRAAHAANTAVVASVFREFSPQGITGVVVIEESHLSIHTWPEHPMPPSISLLAVTAFPELAHQVLFVGLEARRAERLWIDRGTGPRHEIFSAVHDIEEQSNMPFSASILSAL